MELVASTIIAHRLLLDDAISFHWFYWGFSVYRCAILDIWRIAEPKHVHCLQQVKQNIIIGYHHNSIQRSSRILSRREQHSLQWHNISLWLAATAYRSIVCKQSKRRVHSVALISIITPTGNDELSCGCFCIRSLFTDPRNVIDARRVLRAASCNRSVAFIICLESASAVSTAGCFIFYRAHRVPREISSRRDIVWW